MLPDDDEIIHTRVTLLNRLKDWRDHDSWQEFFDIYWKLIYGIARKSGLNEAEAQDVVQETLVSVAKHMPEFKYDPIKGTFKAWLLTMTRWRIINHKRARIPVTDESHAGAETAMDKFPDTNSQDMDSAWDADWERNLLDAAMARVKVRLDPEKFQIFDLYVNQQWPPEKVAQTFNISINQVYLAKGRVTDMLRDEVSRLEKDVT